MNKLKSNLVGFLLIPLLLLSGCTPIGNKTASMTFIYMATAFLAFLLLIGYIFSIKKKRKMVLCVIYICLCCKYRIPYAIRVRHIEYGTLG